MLDWLKHILDSVSHKLTWIIKGTVDPKIKLTYFPLVCSANYLSVIMVICYFIRCWRCLTSFAHNKDRCHSACDAQNLKNTFFENSVLKKNKHIIPTVKHGGGRLMIWACYTATGPGHLGAADSIMNASVYQSILESDLRPSAIS